MNNTHREDSAAAPVGAGEINIRSTVIQEGTGTVEVEYDTPSLYTPHRLMLFGPINGRLEPHPGQPNTGLDRAVLEAVNARLRFRIVADRHPVDEDGRIWDYDNATMYGQERPPEFSTREEATAELRRFETTGDWDDMPRPDYRIEYYIQESD